MKRLTAILLFILFSIVLFAQGDTIPSSGFETIQSPFWKIYTLDEDSTIWMYGGNKYGWTQLVPFRKYKKLLDSAQVKSDTLTWDATKYDLDTLQQKTLDSLLVHWTYINELQNKSDSLSTIQPTTSIEAQTGINNTNYITPRTLSEQGKLNYMPLWGAPEDLYTEKNISADTLKSNVSKSYRYVAAHGISIVDFSDDHTFSSNSDSALVTERAIKAFIQNSIAGGTVYLGGWNASTNTPTLSDATGSNGDMYSVTYTGTQDLGSGSKVWTAGGFIIHNGTEYEFIGYDAVVASVNGFTGVVELCPELSGDTLRIKGNSNYIRIGTATSVSSNAASITSLNNRMVQVEGRDTTGIYHINRALLDAITSADTAHWNGDVYEFEAEQGVSIYSIPFTLRDNMIVLLNGSPLKKNQWGGLGTTNLNLQTNTYDYDLIIIKN